MNDEHVDIQKSLSAKYAWKKHRDSYRKGINKRMRDEMRKIDYKDKKDRPMYNLVDKIKDTNEKLQDVLEAKIDKRDIFDLEGRVTMENIAGGIAVNVNADTGELSISFTLNDTSESQGAYRLQNALQDKDAYEQLFKNILKDVGELAQSIDKDINQIMGKYGLMPTA